LFDMTAIPLQMLNPGEVGIVRHVQGHTDWVHRLREIGLRDGAVVEMVRRGVPCIIRVGGQSLCFRADEGATVLVQCGVPA
jgi:Fe2+ transport system protein FeoA